MIQLPQCRPQSHLIATEQAAVPVDLPKENIHSRFVVPQGHIEPVDDAGPCAAG